MSHTAQEKRLVGCIWPAFHTQALTFCIPSNESICSTICHFYIATFCRCVCLCCINSKNTNIEHGLSDLLSVDTVHRHLRMNHSARCTSGMGAARRRTSLQHVLSPAWCYGQQILCCQVVMLSHLITRSLLHESSLIKARLNSGQIPDIFL